MLVELQRANGVVRPFGFAQDRRAHHVLSLWFDLLTTMSGVEWSKDEQRMAKGENNSIFAIRPSPFFKDSRGRSRRYVYKRIVKLLDGGNAIKLPLVRLECGHEVRTNAAFKARCPIC